MEKSKVSRTYESQIKVFGKPEITLHRGKALTHENGDIYIIVQLIWLLPRDKNPNTHAVMLRRTRDGLLVKRTTEKIKSEIEQGNLKPNDRYNDPRTNVRIEITNTELIMETID